MHFLQLWNTWMAKPTAFMGVLLLLVGCNKSSNNGNSDTSLNPFYQLKEIHSVDSGIVGTWYNATHSFFEYNEHRQLTAYKALMTYKASEQSVVLSNDTLTMQFQYTDSLSKSPYFYTFRYNNKGMPKPDVSKHYLQYQNGQLVVDSSVAEPSNLTAGIVQYSYGVNYVTKMGSVGSKEGDSLYYNNGLLVQQKMLNGTLVVQEFTYVYDTLSPQNPYSSILPACTYLFTEFPFSAKLPSRFHEKYAMGAANVPDTGYYTYTVDTFGRVKAMVCTSNRQLSRVQFTYRQ
jgi:hypothetical protein